jgi:hypothetical protein
MNDKARKTQRLCEDFLERQKGSVLDAIQAARRMDDIWGIKLDWHEFAFALDHMESYGGANRTGQGADGMTEYIIN